MRVSKQICWRTGRTGRTFEGIQVKKAVYNKDKRLFLESLRMDGPQSVGAKCHKQYHTPGWVER